MGKIDYRISRQMQLDLRDAYIKVYSSCWSQQEAYEKMVKQPAPRYYVTAKQAYQIISPMIKGDFGKLNKMKPAKQRLYLSLFEATKELIIKPTFFKKSLWFIMHFAVTQPAPEFFIGEERARQIRRWVMSGVLGNDGKVDDTKINCYAKTRETKRKQRERKRNGLRTKCNEK